MTEFEFLDRQFRRLSEARELRAHDEQRIKAENAKKKQPLKFSAFYTTELMIKEIISDYLEMRRCTTGQNNKD